MNSTARKLAALILTAGAMIGFAASANAEDAWQANHPRRAEVNERLAYQNYRIDRDVACGEMSYREADRLHREDRAIRGEERSMAAYNGGYITRGEQRMLNAQENAVSRQINRY